MKTKEVMFEKKLKELGDMILMAHEFGNDHNDREDQNNLFNEVVLAYKKQKPMKTNKWINSKTRLPELDKFVIVSWKNISTIGYCSNNGVWSVMENMNHEQPVDWDYDYIVNKWMELPK